jgi:hypothetical protein
MKFTHTLRNAATRAIVFFTLLTVIAMAALESGCRHKDNPFIPPDSNAGRWTLIVRGPRIMYRNSAGGYVLNYDSITVRVYDSNGVLRDGIWVRSQCDVSRDSISLNVHSIADTAANWRGCEPYLQYWGSGGPDGYEVIRSYIVADSDTVHAAYGFKVRDP